MTNGSGNDSPVEKLTSVLSGLSLDFFGLTGGTEGVGNLLGIDLVKSITDLLYNIIGEPEDVQNKIGHYLGQFNVTNPSQLIRQLYDTVLQNDAVKELAEVLGSMVISPVLSVLEAYSADDDIDPHEFAEAFHGVCILLTLPKVIAEIAEGSAIGVFMGNLGKAMEPIYWNLGLGFLGWQTLAPLLSSGLQPRLERYYKALYRPERFDLPSIIYLHSIGKLSTTALRKHAAEIGWRDVDINFALEQSYKKLSFSEIKLMVTSGRFTHAEAINELLRHGYNPAYVGVVLDDLLNDDKENDKSTSVATARKAFKENIIPVAEFRRLLGALNYTTKAIDLEIDLVRYEQEQDKRSLSLNQVHGSYVKGIITYGEVSSYLVEQGYSTVDIQHILETWNVEKKPKVLKVNQGTITSALKNGVMNQTEALARLIALGYNSNDAQLLVNNALSTVKKAPRQITLATLISAYTKGIITLSEFNTRLTVLQIPTGDISIYRGLAEQAKIQVADDRDIENAVKVGVIDKSRAVAALQKLGFNPADAQLKIDTALASKIKPQGSITPANYILFYQQGLLADSELLARLALLGIDGNDAKLLMQSAKLAIPRKMSEGDIKEAYLNDVVDVTRANKLLRDTGYDAENAELVLRSWDVTLTKLRPKPSVQQYLKATQDGLITKDELVQKLKELGMLSDTIAFYLKLLETNNLESSEQLSKSDVIGLYGDGLITHNDALERLINLGYTTDDSTLLLSRKAPKIEESQVHNLFMAGYLNPDEYYDILLSVGYDQQTINDYLDRLAVSG